MREGERGSMALGTTGRGIGPAYSDKAARVGIRLEEALYPDHFWGRLLQLSTRVRSGEPGGTETELRGFYEACMAFAQEFRENIQDSSFALREFINARKNILFEGAQATFLDLDHGTYPFVTSSNAVAGGACTGAGVGPMDIQRVTGVAKAYLTRVGRGPFPTELGAEPGSNSEVQGVQNPDLLLDSINSGLAHDSMKGAWLRQKGSEYGATTGRPRRTGWLDLPMLLRAVSVNGLSELAITKLDVLDGLEEIPVCVAYELNGERLKSFPGFHKNLEAVKPIYKTLPGWKGRVSGIQKLSELPANARQYLNFISEFLSVPINIVSTGPGREETIFKIQEIVGKEL